jgi:ribosomal protein S18 acetylase RimI-like enzyme
MIPREEIRAFEVSACRSTPAATRIAVGGWRLFDHDGPWRRASSVQTFEDPGADPDALIARCREIYEKRGRRTIFKLTPASLPVDLDARLEAQGFAHEAPTRVMIRQLTGEAAAAATEAPADPAAASPLEIDLLPDPDDGWIAAYLSWETRLAPHVTALRKLLAGIELARRFALARGPDGPVAAGLATLDGGRLGLFDLVTDPARRSQGIGRRVLDRLIGWGIAEGAGTAWLQVMDDNPRAIALYARCGFEDAYPYWYRVSSDNPFA